MELLIGIIGSLIATMILMAISLARDRMQYQSIGRTHIRAFKGEWEGIVKPQEGIVDVPNEIPITFYIKPGWWKRVYATSSFNSLSPSRGKIINIYNGGFLHDRYLLLRYHNKDHDTIGFGATTLKLSADKQHLYGNIIGYSSHADKMFFSKIELKKKYFD